MRIPAVLGVSLSLAMSTVSCNSEGLPLTVKIDRTGQLASFQNTGSEPLLIQDLYLNDRLDCSEITNTKIELDRRPFYLALDPRNPQTSDPNVVVGEKGKITASLISLPNIADDNGILVDGATLYFDFIIDVRQQRLQPALPTDIQFRILINGAYQPLKFAQAPIGDGVFGGGKRFTLVFADSSPVRIGSYKKSLESIETDFVYDPNISSDPSVGRSGLIGYNGSWSGFLNMAPDPEMFHRIWVDHGLEPTQIREGEIVSWKLSCPGSIVSVKVKANDYEERWVTKEQQ